jgi:hypothetical protein
MNKNYILTILATIVTTLFVVVLASNLLVNKVSDKVIQELKRTYTPGPYDPGFDPDKLNPSVMKEISTTQMEN